MKILTFRLWLSQYDGRSDNNPDHGDVDIDAYGSLSKRLRDKYSLMELKAH